MYESQFEEDLYNLRREKLRQIAALGQKSGLTEAEAIYPNHYAISAPGWSEQQGDLIPWLKQKYDSAAAPISGEQLEADRIEVSIAGRIMAIRAQGKAGFAQLQQGGQRLQIYVRKDDVGSTPEQCEDAFALYKLLDLGDHIGVRGHLFRTRTGELTVHVRPTSAGDRALTFLAKAMLALPDKYHGLEDTELRYRQRYVDLFINTGHSPKPTASAPPPAPPQETVILSEAPAGSAAEGPASPTPEPLNVREVFVKRAAILRALRTFFDTRGYLEVETPMMHTVAGGAAARPFLTHHNALDLDLKLRIAPELYLKRLVVGGMDRVYEINRNFRNEGISTQHNPEFTMLEFYQAYSNYEDLMKLTPELIAFVANEVNGTTVVPWKDNNGKPIDLAPENWRQMTMRGAILRFWRKTWSPSTALYEAFENRESWIRMLEQSLDLVRQRISITWPSDADERAVVTSPIYWTEEMHDRKFLTVTLEALAAGAALGKSIAEVFEYLAEPDLTQPTIIYDFPLAVSPLSKQIPNDPDWVERFEFYIGGFEIGNAFSELNDPDDQRARFEAQLLEKARGDEEAMAEVDEDYVRALGYGLPPTAGEGIGIDRLTMILTGSRSIRDVILFPLLRPQTKPTPTEPDAAQTT